MDLTPIYGLLPEVSEETTTATGIEFGGSQICGLGVERASCWGPSWASAHREPIIEQRPSRSTVLSAWLGAGPTGHAMIVISRWASRGQVPPSCRWGAGGGG